MQGVYLTVSALTKYIKVKLENDIHLKKILLKGEVSNFKAHSSGHFYFSLKDEDAAISAIMFSNYTKMVNFTPKDGDKVLVEGYISVYEARGSYNISIVSMQLDGIGELFLKFEKLKKEFEQQGVFSLEHKKSIPKYPKAVGVITSPTGAVIQDIKTTISRRYLLTKVYLYPALVQGEGSKESIVKQIIKANEDNIVDVIILGRGGGSLEDLWSFNEKEVVLAIYNSRIPIITAIGHETDTTLSDYVSDLRAPTPTAAAELATPDVLELVKNIDALTKQINSFLKDKIKQETIKLVHLEERISVSSPQQKFSSIKDKYKQLDQLLKRNYKEVINKKTNNYILMKSSLIKPNEKLKFMKTRLTDVSNYLNKTYQYLINKKILNLKGVNNQLMSLNPLIILDKGFALTYSDEKLIKSIDDVNKDMIININYVDGVVKTKVLSKKQK